MVLLKASGYVQAFNVKDLDKDKNNKLMSFRIYDEKLLEKHKTNCTTIEDIKILHLMLYQSTMIDI